MMPNGSPIPAGPVPLLGQPDPMDGVEVKLLDLFALERGGGVYVRTVNGHEIHGGQVDLVLAGTPQAVSIIGVRCTLDTGRPVTVLWNHVEVLGPAPEVTR